MPRSTSRMGRTPRRAFGASAANNLKAQLAELSEQVLLGRKIVEERALGDVGGPGDVLHGSSREAAGAELFERGAKQAAADVSFIAFAATRQGPGERRGKRANLAMDTQRDDLQSLMTIGHEFRLVKSRTATHRNEMCGYTGGCDIYGNW